MHIYLGVSFNEHSGTYFGVNMHSTAMQGCSSLACPPPTQASPSTSSQSGYGESVYPQEHGGGGELLTF